MAAGSSRGRSTCAAERATDVPREKYAQFRARLQAARATCPCARAVCPARWAKKRGPRAGPSLETDRTATEWLSGFRRGRDSRLVLEELLVQLEEVLPLIERLVTGQHTPHRP